MPTPSLGASGFLFCGNVGPVDPGELVTQQVLEAARILVARSGLRGVFGIAKTQAHVWTDAEKALLLLIAQLVAEGNP